MYVCMYVFMYLCMYVRMYDPNPFHHSESPFFGDPHLRLRLVLLHLHHAVVVDGSMDGWMDAGCTLLTD